MSGGGSDPIRFLLDGEARELRDVDPTRTVLDLLRYDLKRTGTKEGCAEGDCGACTVVLGKLAKDAEGRDTVRYEAVNACILFAPMLDGKELVTVESLARGGALHPVQRAMVEHHGSQCGFCTPGFVMSLFALHEQMADATSRPGSPPSVGHPADTSPASGGGRQSSDGSPNVDGLGRKVPEVKDVLAGNLCRCTGYGPILAAGEDILQGRARTAGRATAETAALLRSLRREGALELSYDDPLSGVRKRWLVPRTVDELADLAEAHPDATILAGATDVGLWVTKQRRTLPTIISVSEVEGFDRITDEGGRLVIGAGARYADAAAALAAVFPDFGEVIRRLGSAQIRNAGTIGGNIANGSPIGDSPPPLIALGAELVLRKGRERRTIPLEDFFLAYGKQDRRPGEIVESILVPKPEPGRLLRAYKISKRFDQDISALLGAFSLKIEDGVVTDARIAYGGMAATPKRARACEAALVNAPSTIETVARACRALGQDFAPISDLRASAAYRMRVAENLLRKVFYETGPARTPTRLAGAHAYG